MPRSVILVEHDAESRGDRVSAYFENAGADVHRICPAHGDALPAPDDGYDAAVVFGGVQSANDDTEYMHREIEWVARWVDTGRPFLGLCLGGQILARALGARVGPHPDGLCEYGFVEVRPTSSGIAVMARPMHVYAAHREGFEPPEDAELLFTGSRFPNQGFRYRDNAYGLQFHPECTPELMRHWMAFAPSELEKPGAHDRQRQEADSARYDPPMGEWFERFLGRWTNRRT